jgi:hypothetical protein
MMWAFSGGGFSRRARPFLFWQIAVILCRPTSLARCLMLLRWLSLRVVSSLSLLWGGLCYVPRWGSGPRGKRIRLWLSFMPLMRSIFGRISLWVESFRPLGGWIVLWDVVWGGLVLRCLFLVYFVCTRGALRCYI